MVFSSVSFLFYFLPAFLVCYFAAPGVRAKNMVLLAFSLLFYGWGGLSSLVILGASILLNYTMALVIDRQHSARGRLVQLSIAVALNLAGLIFFKYAGFLAENFNLLLPAALQVPVIHPELPLGISFFTFHAISYLVDVYRHKARANGRLEEIAVYIVMFPQLVAGPIVRYSTIGARIRDRRTTLGRVSAGLRIFVIGLSWKVLIADELAPVVNAVLDGTHTPTVLEAWIGITAYMLQIYFDFAGYSNMAIGLAIAMGLKFPRNFNLPYGALSITDHWRRWHMSLSSWFRDYLYIPLGGSRCGPLRNLGNLWAVFFLCGLWHGASWNFIAWGVHHGTFLVLERVGLGKLLERLPRVAQHAYMLLVVLASFVWFRTNTIPQALDYFGALIGLNGTGALPPALMAEIHPLTIVVFILGWPLAMFGLPRPAGKALPEKLRLMLFGAGDTLVTAGLFGLCVLSVGAAAYSPFLYFRF